MAADSWAVYSPQLRRPEVERLIGAVDREPHWEIQLKFREDSNILQDSDVEWRSTASPTTASGKEVILLVPAGERKVALWIKDQHCADVSIKTVNVRPITELAVVAQYPLLFAQSPPQYVQEEANSWAWYNRAALGDGYHNGGADAGKHSYFHALGVVEWGVTPTEDIADAHEHENLVSAGPPNESCMDIHNNQIGRSLPAIVGNSPDALRAEVIKKVQGGDMLILEGTLDSSVVAGAPLGNGTTPTGTVLNPEGRALLVPSNIPPTPPAQ